jgi:hypothetical protein
MSFILSGALNNEKKNIKQMLGKLMLGKYYPLISKLDQ